VDAKEIMAEGLRAVAAYRDYEQSTPAADVMANTLAALSHRLGRIVEWVADDTEECAMCAFPESSRVYLRIGDTLVCQEHIWRGMVAVLGPHPRYSDTLCTCISVAVTADQSETVGPCDKHGRP
jgi:hypothetical protein